MSKYVDYKCTVWRRLEFDDSVDTDVIISKIKEGFLPAELCDIEELQFKGFHFIDNTEEFISLEESDGDVTMEVYDDNNMIWDNSYQTAINEIENDSK